MNHDFLLKTEAPVIPISVGKKQSLSNQGDDRNSDKNQVFSSELDKQIDQQLPIGKRVERSSVPLESAEITSEGSSQKAATILDENGKPLPSESEIAEEFVTQLLADFEGDPELKKVLAERIEQFVNSILTEQESKLDLKDSLTGLLAELVKAGLGGELKGEQATNTSVLKGSAQGIKDEALSGVNNQLASQGDIGKLKLTTPNPVKELLGEPGNKTTSQAAPLLEPGLGQKTVIVNPVSAAITDNTKTPEQIQTLERIQSLLQRIQAAVAREISGETEQKSDKVALIAELVKKIIPEAQTSLKVSESISAGKETTISGPLSQLRPDILQALSKKPLASDALSLNKADTLKTVGSKTDLLTLEDKKIERITQLVDLLKPMKADELQLRPAPSERPIPTSIPVSQPSPLASAAKSELPTLDIQPSMQSKAWNQVLSSRVIWMATEGLQQAALKLNPANLGPVEVRLRVQNEQVNVAFIAQNPATRDALEQALPRLRESFVENGLALSSADVSDQASHEAKEDEAQKNNSNNKGSQNADISALSTADNNSDKTVTGVEENNEAGVNVYA